MLYFSVQLPEHFSFQAYRFSTSFLELEIGPGKKHRIFPSYSSPPAFAPSFEGDAGVVKHPRRRTLMETRQRILHNLDIPLAQRKRTHTGPYRWTPTPPMSGRGFYLETSQKDDNLECATHGAGFRLRIYHANEHLSGRLSRTTGYGSDDILDTYKPIVLRLPRGRGFLAGWTMGPGMCAEMDPHIYAEACSAAHAAHSIAEYGADKESDYQEAYQKGIELREELRDALALMSEGINHAHAAVDALAKGAKDAARLLKAEADRTIQSALQMRRSVWTSMENSYQEDAMREGFADA
jgi:hypothetical protein